MPGSLQDDSKSEIKGFRASYMKTSSSSSFQLQRRSYVLSGRSKT